MEDKALAPINPSETKIGGFFQNSDKKLLLHQKDYALR